MVQSIKLLEEILKILQQVFYLFYSRRNTMLIKPTSCFL